MLFFSEVSKSYTPEIGEKKKAAVRHLSFSMEKGETLGLVGANGAGKTTCIRLIMDFIRPDQGSILLNNEPVSTPYLRKYIGYLPEIPAFPTSLTFMDMLHFSARAHGMSASNFQINSEKWTKSLGLWESRKRPIRTYSKGMQQRAGFILALLHDPSFLILDEPMSGLDPIGRVQIAELIQLLKKQGKTILFCTHILEDVDRLADKILILHHGEKKYEGNPCDLYRQYNTTSINHAFLASIDMRQAT